MLFELAGRVTRSHGQERKLIDSQTNEESKVYTRESDSTDDIRSDRCRAIWPLSNCAEATRESLIKDAAKLMTSCLSPLAGQERAREASRWWSTGVLCPLARSFNQTLQLRK